MVEHLRADQEVPSSILGAPFALAALSIELFFVLELIKASYCSEITAADVRPALLC